MEILSLELESYILKDQLNFYAQIAKQNEIRLLLIKFPIFPPQKNSEIIKFGNYLKAVRYHHFKPSQNYSIRIKQVEEVTESINNTRIITFFSGFFAVFFANYGYYRFTKKVRAGSGVVELAKFFILSFGFGGLICDFGARHLRPQHYMERTQILNKLRSDLSSDSDLADFYQKTSFLFN